MAITWKVRKRYTSNIHFCLKFSLNNREDTCEIRPLSELLRLTSSVYGRLEPLAERTTCPNLQSSEEFKTDSGNCGNANLLRSENLLHTHPS